MVFSYVKQRPPGNPPHLLGYQVDGDVLTVTHAANGAETVDTFDFSAVQNEGVVATFEIETSLPVQPVIEAHRNAAGEMHVTLLDWGGTRG